MNRLTEVGQALWIIDSILPELMVNMALQDDEYGIICKSIQCCRLDLFTVLRLVIIIITLEDSDHRISDIFMAGICHLRDLPIHYFVESKNTHFQNLTERIKNILVPDNDIIFLLTLLRRNSVNKYH